MKKILLAALWLPLTALAQSYPSPHFNNVTIDGTLSVTGAPVFTTPVPTASGGLGANNGTATGVPVFSAGTATVTAATGSGAPVLGTSPSIATPTITGSFTATGLVTTGDLASQAANTILANATASAASPTAFAMPPCSTSSSALNYTSGTGIGCNSAINAATLGSATFAAPGPIGSTTPSTGAFTTLSTTSAPTLGSTTFYPTVATNAALQALATTTTSTVTRLGFYASGDSPPLVYTASGSACSLNSGSGDNGSQVQSSNGKCWLASFGPGPADVREWGAKGDGSTDNTTAMQAAHNTGMLIYYPGGIYNFTTISFVQGGMVGDGQNLSILNSTDTSTNDLITVTGTGIAPAYFNAISVYGSGSKTTGAALRFNASTGMLAFPQIVNVGFDTIPTGIYFSNTQQFVIDGDTFINYSAQGVHIENVVNSDAGDSFINNSFFNTAVPTGSTQGIWYRSSGGLKVSNTKILGGNNGFVMGWIGTNSADLLMSNVSIEDTTADCVYLGRDSGTGNFGSVMISNSEFGCPSGIVTDSSSFLTLVTLTNNVYNLMSTTGTALLLSTVSNIAIGPQVINAQAGAGTTVGVSVPSGNTNGKIAPQTFVNVPAANRMVIGSSSVTYTESPQTISVGTVTTSSAYAGLFVGTASVSFPRAYSVAPTSVVCNTADTADGAIAANAGAITTTGFNVVVVGATSGGAVTGTTCTANGGVL